jgi:RHS repeat-associated protein
MNLVDRANRQRSLTAMSRTLRSGRIAANASVPTTTYSYDANGNLLQAGGWSYVWDYLNRMLASGYNKSTTTYAYDPSGARVLQTSTTSTTYYPNKYYSFTSTKIGANTYATSTNYIWNGDTLLATVDQRLYNGAATGSPITRYIHPDHLGSTNAVTDQNGNLVQLLDYYPYGATRVATSTYPTNEKRQYIDQFSDAQTGLNYLNARYYEGQRGQFLSQDPVFWGSKQNLADPQSLNVYSYANDNPINRSDPAGLAAYAYSRSVDPNSPLLNLYAHNFIYIVPSQGEVLPALYSNSMCVDTTRPFTLGGYNDRRSVLGVTNVSYLAKHANDSYDSKLATAQQSAYGVAMTPIRPNAAVTEAQQDAALVESFNQQPNDYGLYGGIGLLSMQNSNNVFTTVQKNAGVNTAEINRQQSTLQSATQRPAPGVGITQNVSISNIINTISTIAKTLSTLISHQTPTR